MPDVRKIRVVVVTLQRALELVSLLCTRNGADVSYHDCRCQQIKLRRIEPILLDRKIKELRSRKERILNSKIVTTHETMVEDHDDVVIGKRDL